MLSVSMISPCSQTSDFKSDITSTQLSSTLPPQDHGLSRITEMEGIQEPVPRSFTVLSGPGVQPYALSKELSGINQSLSKNLPLPSTPEHANLSMSKEMNSGLPQRLDRPHTVNGSNRSSSSASVQPLDQSNEPDNRVLCDNCDEWITIKDVDGNDNGLWSEHVASCSYKRSERDISPSVAEDASTSISATPAPTGESNGKHEINTAFRRRRVKHYESERLSLLQRDPQVEAVEEYRVLCGFCDTWIELRKDRPYCPIAWTAHKLQCVIRRRNPIQRKVKREQLAFGVPPEGPSPYAVQGRRTEEERLRFLETDPHATSVEPHRVLCGICRRWIQLRKNSTYCTAPWVQHVRKCAAKHDIPRRDGGSGGYMEEDGEDEIESEGGTLRRRVDSIPSPMKRPRGRPRKRKVGEMSKDGHTSFPLRRVSGASPNHNNRRPNGRSSPSPLPVRTPSPLPAHPYDHDVYWYPTHPPMSSYYPLYAGSQYSEQDDSYSLYFHTQPPTQPAAPARSRAKPSKPTNHNSSHGRTSPPPGPPGSMPPSGLAGSPGPDMISSQGRAWLVWRLRDYSTNPCPMDAAAGSDHRHHTAALSEASGSGSNSERLPMFRSGTWPHLLDPEDPAQQNLSPYVHPELSPENGSAPSARPPPPPPPPPVEDPGMFSFNSSAHIPMRKNDAYTTQAPPAPHEPGLDPRTMKTPTVAVPPAAPLGADLDSAESRLAFTLDSIAYLFNTSFKNADDMSLEILMEFMNRTIPQEQRYDALELSGHVSVLGERQLLIHKGQGGVQLAPPAP